MVQVAAPALAAGLVAAIYDRLQCHCLSPVVLRVLLERPCRPENFQQVQSTTQAVLPFDLCSDLLTLMYLFLQPRVLLLSVSSSKTSTRVRACRWLANKKVRSTKGRVQVWPSRRRCTKHFLVRAKPSPIRRCDSVSCDSCSSCVTHTRTDARSGVALPESKNSPQGQPQGGKAG